MKKIYAVIFSALLSVASFAADDLYAIGPAGAYTPPQGGTYTATFQKLEDVAAFLQTYTLPTGKDRVVFEFQIPYSEPTITSPITFSSTINALIRPVQGHAGFISNAEPGSGNAIFYLDGAKNLVFDGRAGSTGNIKWTIDNKQATGIRGAVFALINGSQDNEITYLNLRSGVSSSTNGAILFGNSTGPATNDNNFIRYNKFSPTAAGLSYTNGICSEALANKANSGNEIKGNQFVDYSANGILLTTNGAGNGWFIEYNSFYFGTPVTERITGINILGGQDFFIEHNSFGGSDENRGGFPTDINKEGGYAFIGIDLHVYGAATSTSVGYNLFGNIRARNNNSTDGAFIGIRVKNGGVNVYENEIGKELIITEGDTYAVLMNGSGGNQIYKNYITNIHGELAGNYTFNAICINGQGAHMVRLNQIAASCYSSNNTNTDPLSAAAAIVNNAVNNCTIKENVISFANISTTAKAPMSIFAINEGTVEIRDNLISANGTNNGQTGVNAGYSYGLYQSGGTVNMHNNYIALGTGAKENIRGIELHTSNSGNKYIYNTIYLGGTPGGGTESSYCFYRHASVAGGLQTIVNNIFYNEHTSTRNYAIGTGVTTNWSDITISNNLYVSTGTMMADFGGVDKTFAQWSAETGEKYCYHKSAIELPASQFFENNSPWGGDLRIKWSNSACWFVNGKAKPLAGYDFDYGGPLWGHPRSESTASGTSDIGAFEFEPNPGVEPPPADPSTSPGLGSTQVFSIGGREIAAINWGNSGSVPTSVTMKYFSGTQPPSPPATIPPGTTTPQLLNAYWDITANGGSGFSYSLELYLDPSQMGNLAIADAHLFKKPAATGWEDRPGTIVDQAGYELRIENETSFSLFTAANSATVLPVSLLYFNAAKKEQDVILSWKTASELDNKLFEVQRSFDGNQFTTIRSVQPSIKKEYVAEDDNILVKQAGKIFYRLKMISSSGSASYSAVTMIDNSNAKPAAVKLLSENPFSDHIDIQFNNERSGDATVTLYNAEGKRVGIRSLKLPAGSSSVRMNELQSLPAATYFVQIVSGNTVVRSKLVKQ